MQVHQYQKNIDWLKEHEVDYPFRCQTNGCQYPGPLQVGQALPEIKFIRAPLGRVAEWGFPDDESMVKFKQRFTTIDNKS